MATSQMSEVISRIRRAALLRDGAGLTDSQLLEDYLSRHDDAALGALVWRHGPMVWGVCRRILNNHHEAEDAFQATFLVLLRKASSIVSRELLANWLYGVARQTALKARATAAKRKLRERQVTEMPEPAVTEQHLWRDLRPLLDEELSRLPDKYRVLIVLCDLEGKTRKDAARQLGCPEGTVAGRLARARGMLAKRLALRGMILSGGAVATILTQNAAAASVPATVASSTVKALTLFGAGQAAAGGALSARAIVLMEGVLKTMLLSKLSVVFLVVPAVVVLAGMTAISSHQIQAQGRETVNAQDKPTVPATAAQGAGPKQAKAEPTIVKMEGSVDALAWSPNGKLVATNVRTWEGDGEKKDITGHTVQLRDAQTGKVVKTLFESDWQNVSSVALTPDGKSVAAAIFKRVGNQQADIIQLWNVETGKETIALEGAESFLQKVACSADGKVIASAGWIAGPDGGIKTGEICLWDLSTGKILWQTKGHLSEIHGLAVSPDGKLVATCSTDMAIKLWDTEKGACKHTLAGHGENGVYSVAFSPDGKLLASGGLDGTVRLWNTEKGELKQTLTEGYVKGMMVLVAFSPDGKTLASAGDTDLKPRKGDVKLWDTQTGKIKQTFEGHVESVYSLAFSPDGTTMAVGCWNKKLVLLPVGKPNLRREK